MEWQHGRHSRTPQAPGTHHRKRGTVTLADPTLCRGACTSMVLRRCGCVLQSNPAGVPISVAGGKQFGEFGQSKSEDCKFAQSKSEEYKSAAFARGITNNDYESTTMRDSLEAFISHSWSAGRWPKYFTLLFHFNMGPAVIAAIVTSIVVFGIRYALTNPTDFDAYLVTPQPCYCTFSGFATFLIVISNWHYVSKECKCLCNYVFLDKLCINQVNPTLKKAGIEAIGAILANSQMLLVLWDNTYFTRLWCTFEIAAFLHKRKSSSMVMAGGQSFASVAGSFSVNSTYSRGQGSTRFARRRRILVRPVMLGFSMVFLWAGCLAGEILNEILLWATWSHQHHSYKRLRQLNAILAFISYSLACTPFVESFRKFAADMGNLDAQLANFDPREVRCFCCDNDHCHPLTGEELPCDRKLVFNSIAHWHGAGDEQVGLEQFEHFVRVPFREIVKSDFGDWARMPYLYMVAVSLGSGLRSMDGELAKAFMSNKKNGYHFSIKSLYTCMRVADTLFLRFPLIMGVMVFLASICAGRERRFRCVSVFVAFILSMGTHAFGFTWGIFGRCLDEKVIKLNQGRTFVPVYFAWMLMEFFLVHGIYAGGRFDFTKWFRHPSSSEKEVEASPTQSIELSDVSEQRNDVSARKM